MTRARVNFTLAPETVKVLREIGNASRYLDTLVLTRDRRWRRALAGLRGEGWSLAAIRQELATGKVNLLDHRGHTGRRLRVLSRELRAGNAALDAALSTTSRKRRVA